MLITGETGTGKELIARAIHCPNDCSGNSCGASAPSPPEGQPPQKSYRDFNDGWPLNSWSVTENSNGYQSAYIRLLSKFVD